MSVAFSFCYENYVSLEPYQPTRCEVEQNKRGLPIISWQSTGVGPLVRQLSPADYLALQQLVVYELDFFSLPPRIDAEVVDGDWPKFTLKLHGRRHRSEGLSAGLVEPRIQRLQDEMHALIDRYFSREERQPTAVY